MTRKRKPCIEALPPEMMAVAVAAFQDRTHHDSFTLMVYLDGCGCSLKHRDARVKTAQALLEHLECAGWLFRDRMGWFLRTTAPAAGVADAGGASDRGAPVAASTPTGEIMTMTPPDFKTQSDFGSCYLLFQEWLSDDDEPPNRLLGAGSTITTRRGSRPCGSTCAKID
jgi:hypothetical protein